jgi:hypothetical protein
MSPLSYNKSPPPSPPSKKCPIGHHLNVLQSDAALTDLIALKRQHQFRRGDIRNIAERNGITFRSKEYYRLSKQVYRTIKMSYKVIGVTGCSPSNGSQPTPQLEAPSPIGVHFASFYQTWLVDPRIIVDTLPWHGTPDGRGWYGFVTEDVTLKAWKGGKIIVYDKNALHWKSTLVKELTVRGWSGEQFHALDESLTKNGVRKDITIPYPGANSHTVKPVHINEGGIVIDGYGDETPKKGGNIEISINVTEIQQRLEQVESEVRALPKSVGLLLGGVPTTEILNNMMLAIVKISEQNMKVSERVDSLYQLILHNLLGDKKAPSDSVAKEGRPPMQDPSCRTPGSSTGGASITDSSAKAGSEVPPYAAENQTELGSSRGSDESYQAQLREEITGTYHSPHSKSPSDRIPGACPKLVRGWKDNLFCGPRLLVYANGEMKSDDFANHCIGDFQTCPFYPPPKRVDYSQ